MDLHPGQPHIRQPRLDRRRRAQKSMLATQSDRARMVTFTPKISWIMMTALAGFVAGSATQAWKLPAPSVA